MASMTRSHIMKSFVARIWLERSGDTDPQWRGHIRYIQGSEEIYFHDLDEMSAFMHRIGGLSAVRPVEATGRLVSLEPKSDATRRNPETGGKRD